MRHERKNVRTHHVIFDFERGGEEGTGERRESVNIPDEAGAEDILWTVSRSKKIKGGVRVVDEQIAKCLAKKNCGTKQALALPSPFHTSSSSPSPDPLG